MGVITVTIGTSVSVEKLVYKTLNTFSNKTDFFVCLSPVGKCSLTNLCPVFSTQAGLPSNQAHPRTQTLGNQTTTTNLLRWLHLL